MPSDQVSPRRSRRVATIAVIAVVAAVAIALGVRAHEAHSVVKWTDEQAVPVVAWVRADRGGEGDALKLPGHLVAWSQAPLHARVSGYLKVWNADIGDQVKEGQVLAEIDTPELTQQIAQAKGQLLQARADAEIAKTSALRWKNMLASHSVSRQEADEKQADADAADATFAAAQAEYARLQELGAYRQVRAPFSGTVTARNVDIGQLVHADGTGLPLFEMADNHRLRLMVPIPQSYAAAVHDGMTAEVEVPDRPGRKFQAKLLSNSSAIDRNSGTLLAQFVIDNPDGVLLPGSYAQVQVPLGASASDTNVQIPASALIFRAQGSQVAVLEPGNKIALRNIHIALDLGNSLEVDQGLKPGDHVVNNPPDALRDGDVVRATQEGGAHAQA